MSASPKPLLVLNASAGSGKTYNLVRNYLVLLLKDADDRADLGQIIAMTFTNKAAIEMKTRIIRDLNRLANPGVADEGYVAELCRLVDQQPDQLRKNAALVLKKMLHRYEDFNVLTIDKFNLKLIRSFSRDLNLPDQFEIVIDERLILEKSVDELLSTIDKNDRNRIYDLAINFARTNLDEDTKWDVRKALLEVASVLTDERSYHVIQKLIEKEFTQVDYDLWKLRHKEYRHEIQIWQRKLQLIFDEVQPQTGDFSDGSRTYNRLNKAIKETGDAKTQLETFKATPAFIDHLEKTISKKGNPEPSQTALQFYAWWNSVFADYFELELKVKQFYLLSILKELAKHMEGIREKDAIIRVSEFNKLVAELVKDEEAPFIYERLGNRFRHFFLDEFQDTSHLQWTNLIPLLHESLSSNKFNLIVGDPKQSIYRFKNGVAEQFVALPGIYNPQNDPKIALRSYYFEQQGRTDELTENWRSAKEIVDFNNALFTALKADFPESGQPYYNQIIQVPKGKDGGYIEFMLSSDKDEREEQRLDQLLQWVQSCVADGYLPGEICVLAKTKDNCNAFANHLKQHGFQVVSSDSLLVNSDQFVQLIIAFCRWRNNEKNIQLAMRFAEIYFRLFRPETAFVDFQSCFVTRQDDEKQRVVFDIPTFIAQSGMDENILSFGYQDLFSLVQQVIRSFNIDELNNAYVHQLLDIAARFDLQNGPDLSGFLSWYDAVAYKSNVQLPENTHSIRVMTAHKSKGLEFPVVIIPNIKFDATSPKKKSFLIESADHFVRTNLTKSDAELPAIKPLTEQENDAIIMDAYNLLYVAFTRPVDRLYFINQTAGSPGSLEKAVTKTLRQLKPELPEDTLISIGTKPLRTPEKEEKDLAFHPVSLNDFLWFPEISILSPEEAEEHDLHRRQRFGQQLHAIMEQNQDAEQASAAIRKGLLKGTIDADLEVELREQVERLFANQAYSKLLSGGHQLDERTLLVDEKTRLRPDKIVTWSDKTVVIDFKTGERKPEHITQVVQYLFALDMMKYPELEGYLYYVSENELVRVR